MLSEFQRKKILHLFNFYDVNQDGALGRIDFERSANALIAACAYEPNSRAAHSIQASYGDYWAYLQRYMDLDLNKTISEEEFLNRYEFLSRQPESIESLIISTTEYVVQLTDIDGNGIINRNEYVTYLVVHNVDEAHAHRSFELLDHNRSDTLTRDEVLNSVRIFLTSDEPILPGNELFGPIA